MCDESSLTGESAPVEKDASALLAADTPVAERVNMVYSGCFITGGTGKMVVTDVGDATQFGLIAREIQGGDEGKTPLQEKMARLGKIITIIGAVCAALIFLIQLGYIIFMGSDDYFADISGYFISSIVLMVAAVPEGLPTIVAISLSINIARMARENALVKKMVASETVGCINVICSDKTGTLTENRMTVVDVWTEGGFCDVAALRSEPMLQNFCINGTADLYEEEGNIRFVGNPTEGALLVAAGKCGVDYKAVREGADVVDLYPFSSDTKNMTSCVRAEGGYTVYTKGSPEKILALCGVDADTRSRIEEGIVSLQKRARRVLAFAHKQVQQRPASREEAEAGMTFDGFVGIADPLRAEVFDAVKTCKTAGIEVKMLTGDNIVTATAIADELGILDEDHIAVEASQLEALPDDEFSRILPKVRVIARSTPLLKMRVVKELKAEGNVVAVTGDGINDAPALKNADVGIAMGISGTEVSKEAADIVLLNDSFSTIVTTVKWGRGIYENFKRFIQFQLTVNVASVLTVFLCTVHRAVRGRVRVSLLRPRPALDQHHHGRPARPHPRPRAHPRRPDAAQAHRPQREHRLARNDGAHRRQWRVHVRRLPRADVLELPRRRPRDGADFRLYPVRALPDVQRLQLPRAGRREHLPALLQKPPDAGRLRHLPRAAGWSSPSSAAACFDTVPLDALSWLKIVALALSVVVLDEVVRLVRRIARPRP